MSRQARVGLVVVAGVLLFIVALFAIANRSFLFSDTFYVRSRFASVAGLQSGAEVQYQGVNVGRVENVLLPNGPGEKIVVTMAIKESARHLIHQKTQAQIKTDGLVGNQIVVLVNVNDEIADIVEEGEFIPGVEPFDLYEITDMMLSTVAQFDTAAATFQRIMLDVGNGQGTLGKLIYDPALYDGFVATTYETQRVMDNLGDNAAALVQLAQQATGGVNSILNKVDNGDGTLARMLNDPGVYNKLLATSDTLQAISKNLRAITGSAENAANWGALGMFRFAENMEALKHNWLFKRYFEERGYADAAPFETRERAIAQSEQAIKQKQRELFEWEQRLKALEARLDAVDKPAPKALPEGRPPNDTDVRNDSDARNDDAPPSGNAEDTGDGSRKGQ